MTKFKEGDRVEVTIVGDVTHAYSDDIVQLDNGVIIGPRKNGSVRLRKVAPSKPKVGEVIDGARLKATSWKQGTVVVSCGIPAMLTKYGKWVEPSFTEGWGFRDVDDDDEFTVVHVA